MHWGRLATVYIREAVFTGNFVNSKYKAALFRDVWVGSKHGNGPSRVVWRFCLGQEVLASPTGEVGVLVVPILYNRFYSWKPWVEQERRNAVWIELSGKGEGKSRRGMGKHVNAEVRVRFRVGAFAGEYY